MANTAALRVKERATRLSLTAIAGMKSVAGIFKTEVFKTDGNAAQQEALQKGGASRPFLFDVGQTFLSVLLPNAEGKNAHPTGST